MGELMRRPDNWAEDVKTLKMPVVLVCGDSDMFRPEHIVQFYRLLGGGLEDAGWRREHMAQNRLAILPDLTHYELFMAPEPVSTTPPVLDGTSKAPSWDQQVKQRSPRRRAAVSSAGPAGDLPGIPAVDRNGAPDAGEGHGMG